MSDIAIKVEHLGKLYRLGEVGTGTISQDLKRWWAVTRGKEDPFAKIGETNDRTRKGGSDIVWALKDVSFEVKEGEVMGIIGRNGAGKSTLLKLLSKVTQPTTGNIKVKGRIASLLEVGTGFHPDLTGRENIFLNGAILGMTKREIQSKFDEIVDFSGVERYIDTPVKRYSSGMYVRLAFAVAAFLEPEILIVDEVLAVGDAEFQKKCLGRMKDVSTNDGRTVLFVSHNMGAIQNLCKKAVLMQHGTVVEQGECLSVVTSYMALNRKTNSHLEVKPGTIGIAKILFKDKRGLDRTVFAVNEEINVEYEVFNDTDEPQEFHLVLSIYKNQELISNLSTFYNGELIKVSRKERVSVNLALMHSRLLEGFYTFNVALFKGTFNHPTVLSKIDDFEAFQIEGGNPFNNGIIPKYGSVLIESDWKIE